MSDFVELVLPNVLRPCVTPAIKGYNSIRPQSLAELNDLRIQQGLIIKDLLFVFLGLEGFYIRYSEKYDLGSADSRIRGPDFKIAKHLDISLKSITKKLIKYGRYYSALKSFIEIYDTHQSGKVLQRLCFEIEKFLCRYEQLVVQIEQEFETNSGFNLSFLENNVLRSSEVSVEIDLLYDIVTLIHEESAVRYKQSKHAAVNDEAYFQNFIKTIQNDLRETGSINLTTDQTNFELCKGGLILQKIQKLSSERYLGDSVKSGIANKLFDSISIDYVDMLNGWLINGEINDPYDEFLIKENKIEGKVGSQYSEKYWEEVYVTRIDGIIEQFQSRDLQMKLLATGKFLNIFKICTGVNDTSIGNEVVGIISLSSRDLELKIHEFYLRANKLLMKLYFEGYQLTTLIEKLQGVYFLKDSFDIDNFIRKSFNDLRRNKYGVSISKLKRQYEEEEQKHILRKNDSDDLDELSVTLNMDYTNFYDLAREILDVQSFDAMSALDSSSKFKTLLNKSLERNNPPISSGSLGSSTTTGGLFLTLINLMTIQ